MQARNGTVSTTDCSSLVGAVSELATESTVPSCSFFAQVTGRMIYLRFYVEENHLPESFWCISYFFMVNYSTQTQSRSILTQEEVLSLFQNLVVEW